MFTIASRSGDCRARTATLLLPHGPLPTPAFMPVGTNGAVKAVTHGDLRELGYSMILSNTYHLYLRPGTGVIGRFGDLHSFSSWDRNILTDSGGFQIFSLANFRKIDHDGVRFRSHIDGSSHRLSPEKVVEVQTILGSDVMMPLDVCTPPGISFKEAEQAVALTSEWAVRSRRTWRELSPPGLLFAIVQGNFFKDLRRRSLEDLCALDLPGMAIGGLSVGEELPVFLDHLEHVCSLLPSEKPRYVMGIGTPEYVLHAVEQGVDMFDCVFPTRVARNGMVFTRDGRLVLKKDSNAHSDLPLDPQCRCRVCAAYSRAYLRHLVKSGEILAPMLATYHNLAFMKDLVDDIRRAIEEDRFMSFKKAFLDRYTAADDL